MEVGTRAAHCDCTTHCKMGVEIMGDCVCRLPGDTVTAYCDICDPTHTKTTWHNNGSCISCVRTAREKKKEMNAARHAEILTSPPSQIDYTNETEAIIVKPAAPVQENSMLLEIVLRINGAEISVTKDAGLIGRMLQCK